MNLYDKTKEKIAGLFPKAEAAELLNENQEENDTDVEHVEHEEHKKKKKKHKVGFRDRKV